MSAAELIRYGSTPMGTFGTLQLGGRQWFTVERPWAQNKPRESCIPAGWYPLRLGTFHTGGYPAYELSDVPGRSQVKIHKANLASEVEGCIALGKSLGVVKGEWAVLQSADAFDEWMQAAALDQPTHLGIMWTAVEPSV